MYFSTLQLSGTVGASSEYINLQYALVQNVNFSMPTTASNVSYTGIIYNYYSVTPTLCGILIPLGIIIAVGLGYFFCSANGMDLPGAYPSGQNVGFTEK